MPRSPSGAGAPSSRRIRPIRIFGTLGALLWLALPIAAYSYLTSVASERSLNPAVDVWSPVEPTESATRTTISIVIERADGTDVFAPSWTGLVESTTIVPRAVIASGAELATISGIDRVAYASDRPFSSVLKRDDEGTQVAQLNQLLRDRGFDAPESDYFGLRTLLALREFADSLGVQDSDDIESFDPSWLVYLPSSPVTVDEASIFVGAPAPAAGESIAKTRPEIVSARFDAETDSTAATDDAPEVVTNPFTAPDGGSLEIGSVALPIGPDRTSLDPSAFAQLATLVAAGQSRVEATLVAPAPEGDWALPSQAVVVDEEGRACVVLRTGSSISVADVEVRSSDLGRSYVSGAIPAGADVLVASREGHIEC